jgi:multiple sugar transport system permease protein
MSYGIFFMRQNVEATIPDDLLDMARIDGVSELGIYAKMALPLLSGSVGALSIFAFMQSWAAFIWPLIITTTRDLWTMELGLGMFQYRFTVDLGPINAGSMLSIIPVLIVFLILRKKIVQGITLSGMKE